ncbi:MAG: electron transport complex subunit RsxE, partial [Clostridia bacterium]|nr:electron transport complex subunit RsxE [Clostridia bacterium]
FVLVGSNVFISLLRNVIPDDVRLPAYIVIIASFVTIVQQIIKAYSPALDSALGLYIPLIVVNCIILARAEMFANKNGVLDSALDGLGMGVGFAFVLVVMGSIRELLGAGTIFGITVTAKVIDPMLIMIMAPGGFFTFGCLIALINKINAKQGKKVKTDVSCEACPAAEICGVTEEAKEAE